MRDMLMMVVVRKTKGIKIIKERLVTWASSLQGVGSRQPYIYVTAQLTESRLISGSLHLRRKRVMFSTVVVASKTGLHRCEEVIPLSDPDLIGVEARWITACGPSVYRESRFPLFTV